MASRQEKGNSSTPMHIKGCSQKCRDVSLEKHITNIAQTESIIPYHDNIFHSHKHENKVTGSGRAKDMEILQSPVVEEGLESGGGAGQKKNNTVGFLLCPQTVFSVL